MHRQPVSASERSMILKNRLAACVAAMSIAVGLISSAASATQPSTATPIKHLVVIFQENVSFDHYFATYPHAANPPGEPAFHAAPDTPTINGLTGTLLTSNPNRLNPQNAVGAVNPFRLDRSQASTASQDHEYGPEQSAFHAGLMDLFPLSVGNGDPATGSATNPLTTTGLVMGYYDGNTVTALWNYAQGFAMSDNSYGTTFGPSTVGRPMASSIARTCARNTLSTTAAAARP
jgi:phospholipase C